MVCVKHVKPHNFLNAKLKTKKDKKMVKKNIHPRWYFSAKVFCDGQLIMKTGSTRSVLSVDVWSGNHPVYTKSRKILDVEGRVERFTRKYGLGYQA